MNRKEFIKKSSMATGALFTTATLDFGKNQTSQELDLNITNPSVKNICKTCGTRYSASKFIEDKCEICLDGRQYLKSYGQQWTSFNELMDKHTIKVKQYSEELYEIMILPDFAIGQRAFFIRNSSGNILWDCIPLITEPIVDFIRKRGGLDAIVISHPHYYSLMQEWAKIFNCPIYIHTADKKWVMDDSESINYWESDKKTLSAKTTLVHAGGHFPGSTVLHTQLKTYGGTLFTGDTLYLSRDKKHLSAMYSYPNVIPLTNKETLKVFDKIGKYNFESLFGAFDNQELQTNAKKIFNGSIQRYKTLSN